MPRIREKMFRQTVWFPEEGREMWKLIKARASLENKSIGKWILDLVKKELELS